jgi:predicted nuclease with TOPRIM domain
VAKSPTEQIREISTDVSIIKTRVDSLLDEVKERKATDERRRDEIAELRQELSSLKQENAVLRQQLQDHISLYQEWDRRRWGLFVMLIGATPSLASGLIATLARK